MRAALCACLAAHFAAGCALLEPDPAAYERIEVGLYNAAERAFVMRPQHDSLEVVEEESRFFVLATRERRMTVLELDEAMRRVREFPLALPIAGTPYLATAENKDGNLRFGLGTRDGETLLPAEFLDPPRRFGNALFLVRRGERHGVYDAAQRRWVNEHGYEDFRILDQSAEHALVRNGERVGLLHASGREVMPVQFDQIEEAPGGYVVFETGGKKGLATLDGRIVLAARYDWLQPDPPGLVWFGQLLPGEKEIRETKVKDTVNYPVPREVKRRNFRTGLMRTDGTVLLAPQFEDHEPFTQGYASARRDGKWGYLDRDGREAHPFQYTDVGAFIKGLAWAVRERAFGVLDLSFRTVVPFRFSGVQWLTGEGSLSSANDVIVARAGNRVELFDASGRRIAELEASEVRDCRHAEQYCLFVRNRKTGVLHTATGAVIVPARYDAISVRPRHKLAIVKVGTRFGAVSFPGNQVLLKTEFHSIEVAQSGLLVLKSANGYQLRPPDGSAPRPLPRAVARVDVLGGRYLRIGTRLGATGLMDQQGEWLLPPRLQAIEHVAEDLFRVER